ncbi:hypothetical protein BDD12DRAFT_847795 [Trichophaea hybrida]|nr:hypothetical protein BDD12DRAFT_847795 [Trichophaea hybrida]
MPKASFDLSVDTGTEAERVYSTEEKELIDLKNPIQLIHQFGDDGTVVWLNKHGEILSLSQSLQDVNGEAKFISVERREIVSFDANFPKRHSNDKTPGGTRETESQSNENKPDIETENEDEFRPELDCASPHTKSRLLGFSRLYEKPNSGFGLRLSSDSGKLGLLSVRYKDDCWPLHQLDIKNVGISVKVQYFINKSQVLQRYTIRSTASRSTELSMDLDLTAALRQTLLGKIQVGPNLSYENHHSIRMQPSSQISLQGPSQKLTIALFKGNDNASIPLNGIEEKDFISILSKDAIYHHEIFQIHPQETIIFTAIYMVTNNETFPNLTLDKEADSELNSTKETNRWWRFKRKSRNTSFVYRRTLEHIVSVAAIPLSISTEGIRPYILTDASVELAHYTIYSVWQMKFLFGMCRLLSVGDFADPQTTKHYMRRIQLITKGYLLWLFELKNTTSFCIDRIEIEEWDEKGQQVKEHNDQTAWDYQFCHECKMYCESLILLHQFQTLFPKETPFVRRLFQKHSPDYWKSINAQKDRSSDLWVLIESSHYQEIPVGVKQFELEYQIQVWMAMDVTKKLAKLLQISKEDDTFNFLRDINPQNFRRNVIERFKTERNIDLPNNVVRESKQVLCAVERSSCEESNIGLYWQLELMVPALNRNFFFLDNLVSEPWSETLGQLDLTGREDYAFSRGFSYKMVWANMNYLSRYLSNDKDSVINLCEARKKLEGLSSAGGLFHDSAPIYNCLEFFSSETAALLLYTDYAAEFDAALPESGAMTAHPKNFRSAITPGPEGIIRMAPEQQRESRPFQQFELIDMRNTAQKAGNLNKKRFLSQEERKFLNENPAYGPPWLSIGPLFFADFERARPQSIGSFDDIKKSLLEICNLKEGWITQLWNSSDRVDFFKRMTDSEVTHNTYTNPDGSIDEKIFLVDFGDKSKSSIFGDASQLISGSNMIDRLVKHRDEKISKKRIVNMEKCTKAFIFTILATHNKGEATHLAKFIYGAIVNCQTIRNFQAIPRHGLWISDFCLGFIEISVHRDKVRRQKDQQRYFPARRSPFLSAGIGSREPPEFDLREASCGFRCLGDIHDRYWTLYFFVNDDASAPGKLRHNLRYVNCLSQRKVLEVQAVLIALEMLLEHTHKILEQVDKVSSPEKSSLFDRYGSENGSGEQTFKNRYKHSVLYPWLIELLQRLFKKCDAAKNAVEEFLAAEESFGKNRPRWSAGDQTKYGQKIGTLRKEVGVQLSKLKETNIEIERRIEWFKNLKEWASSELSLQDARRSIILSESARIFTVVTLIYLPLSFATSVVAVSGLTWGNPVKDLFKIIGIVSLGTIFILVNLNFLDRQFWYLVSQAHKLIQRKMEYKPPIAKSDTPPHDPEAGNTPEKFPLMQKKGFWSQKAETLRVMDSRKELLGDSQSQFPETSSWWYWGFIVFYAVVKLPMTEIAWAVRTTSAKNAERVGPLQRLVRLPWFGLWLVLLVLVYIVLVICVGFMMGLRLIGDGFKLGWYGAAVKEKKGMEKTANANAEEEVEVEVVRATSWWKQPLYAMELELVQEAYHARKTVVPAVATTGLSEGVNSTSKADAPTVPQQVVEAKTEGEKK